MEKLLSQLSVSGFNGESIRTDLSQNTELSLNYAQFVTQLASEIGILLETEERLKSPDGSSSDNLTSWKMEISSFLKEINCPINFLYEGDLQTRLNSSKHRIILLDFLLSELLSARMEKVEKTTSDDASSVDSSTTAQLTESLKTLNLSSPPAGVSPAQFFKQLLSVIERVNPNQRAILIGEPLCNARLSDDQWQLLQQIAMDLESEYAMRRTMLITRLKATVQSFTWSDRGKTMSKAAVEAAEMKEFKTSAFTNVSVADILAARTDLLTIRKVSSVPPATRGIAKAANYGQLTKVKIGKVPDRGGRPSEQAPPPPEMPSWQQRTGPQHGQQGGGGQGGLHFFGGGQGSSGNRGGGHQGGGNNQRGGYNQGGYNQSGGYNQRGGYNQSGGNRGGYNQGNDQHNRGQQGIKNYSQNNMFQNDARYHLQDLSRACQQALGIADPYSSQKQNYNQRQTFNQGAGHSQGGYQDRNKGVQGAGWKKKY